MAVFISHPVFLKPAFGTFHPLSVSRHSTLVELCRTLGWLDDGALRDCPLPGRAVLERFHTGDYLDALEAVARLGKASGETRRRFGIGMAACPVFEGFLTRARATVGGSILAAETALGGDVAFHPAGGTHHGRPGRAAGFCYLNDPVFAILTLLDADVDKVLYVDLDAHHGDGVQAAFDQDPRVFAISLHGAGRWPHSGAADDRGGGRARNLPVPRGLNDTELRFLMEDCILPLAARWDAEAIVVTCGTDALAGDPLSGLELSNRALCGAVDQLVAAVPRAVVLGGGGYNPWTAARCWAALWGRLSGQRLAGGLPGEARTLLGSLDCDLIDEEDIRPGWIVTLEDRPNHGPVRPQIKVLAKQIMT